MAKIKGYQLQFKTFNDVLAFTHGFSTLENCVYVPEKGIFGKGDKFFFVNKPESMERAEKAVAEKSREYIGEVDLDSERVDTAEALGNSYTALKTEFESAMELLLRDVLKSDSEIFEVDREKKFAPAVDIKKLPPEVVQRLEAIVEKSGNKALMANFYDAKEDIEKRDEIVGEMTDEQSRIEPGINCDPNIGVDLLRRSIAAKADKKEIIRMLMANYSSALRQQDYLSALESAEMLIEQGGNKEEGPAWIHKSKLVGWLYKKSEWVRKQVYEKTNGTYKFHISEEDIDTLKRRAVADKILKDAMPQEEFVFPARNKRVKELEAELGEGMVKHLAFITFSQELALAEEQSYHAFAAARIAKKYGFNLQKAINCIIDSHFADGHVHGRPDSGYKALEDQAKEFGIPEELYGPALLFYFNEGLHNFGHDSEVIQKKFGLKEEDVMPLVQSAYNQSKENGNVALMYKLRCEHPAIKDETISADDLKLLAGMLNFRQAKLQNAMYGVPDNEAEELTGEVI